MLIALISFWGAIACKASAALASDMRANAESISIEPAIDAHKSDSLGALRAAVLRSLLILFTAFGFI